MAIIVAGRIHEKTTELLDYYFGDITSGNLYSEDTKNLLSGEKRKKVHIKKPELYNLQSESDHQQ